MVTVRVLGELALESDGHPIDGIASHRARSLLGWLAVHPGLQPRSRVAGVLWPDVLEESARGSLRTTLATLKRELGPAAAVVTATRDRVGIEPGAGASIDLHAFEKLVSAGELAQAVWLCRGELLADLDDDWVREPREQHRHELLGALGRLADEAERSGDLDAALRRTREQVALDPLSEEAQRELVRRLDAGGDRAAALAAYEAYRERLARDLGIPPSAQTRELVERVRRGTTSTESVHSALPPMLSRSEPVRMVGRDAELRRLGEALDSVADRGLGAAVVTGEPGSGKTRLAAEFARRAHGSGAAVWAGRCYEDSPAAYGPFVEALRGRVDLDRLPRWAAAELGRLLPELDESGTAGSPSEGGDPEAARLRLFEAVASVVRDAAGRSPLVLVVDDLQWADPSTVLMLAHLTRSASSARVLLLGTVRNREAGAPDRRIHALLGELGRERRLLRLPLEGLAEDEVSELAASWLGEAPSPGLAAELHRRTAGNAFFVEQLLRQAEEGGVADLAVRVPAGVRDAVGERVEKLGRRGADALAVGAAIGDEFGTREVAEVLGRGIAEVVGHLDAALAASLVREVPGSAGRLRFAHDLVRETVYDGLSAGRRALLHLEIADALERLDGDNGERLPELARHLIEAGADGDVERAAGYALGAARQALARLAYEDAAGVCDRALQLAEQARATGHWRVALLLASGDAWLRAGDEGCARARFVEAAEAARSIGEPELLARAALGFAGLGVSITGPRADVCALLEEALSAVPATSALRPPLLARLAIELYYEPPPRGRSATLSEEAVAAARRVGGKAVLDALNARHVALWGPDHLEERLEIADELVELARRLGDRETELQGCNWRVLDLLEAGRFDLAEDAIGVHEAMAAELRLPAYSWHGHMWRAMLAGLRGRFEEADGLTTEGEAIGRRAGDENAAQLFRIQHLYWRWSTGGLTEADVITMEQIERASPVPHVWRGALAHALTDLGGAERARAWLEFGVRDLEGIPRDVNWLVTLTLLGHAAAELGDLVRTKSIYELALPYGGRDVFAGRATVCYGSADLMLGIMADALSRRDEAERHFEAALQRHSEIGAVALFARTRELFAAMLERRGEVARAGAVRKTPHAPLTRISR